MAAVTQANVTVIASDRLGDRSGKSTFQRVKASVVLSTQGATSGDLIPGLFGLSTIFDVYSYRFDTTNPADTLVDVRTDGTNIYTFTPTSPSAPANQTGTIYLIVNGIAL